MSGELLGVLGGSFDPVHQGHLQLARLSREEAGLTKVLMMPAASPPHKQNHRLCSFSHRLAMLQLACAGDQHLVVSAVEGSLPQPSYTIDSLLRLKAQHPSARLAFILGGDSFLEFASWKSHQRIISLVDLIIGPRRGYEPQGLSPVICGFGYHTTDHENLFLSQAGTRLIVLKKVPQEISSSEIRHALARGNLPRQMIPDTVLSYIHRHQLYRNEY